MYGRRAALRGLLDILNTVGKRWYCRVLAIDLGIDSFASACHCL